MTVNETQELERLRGIVERVATLAERTWPENRKTYPSDDNLARAAVCAIELCEQELLNAIYGDNAPILCGECGPGAD